MPGPTTTLPGAPLRLMAVEVFEVNQANGWFEDDRTVGDDLALLHSEVSEALEAFRSWGLDDVTEIECRKGPSIIAHTAFGDGSHLCKPQGVGSELADVLIRLLDTVTRRDVVPAWLDGPLSHVRRQILPDGPSFGDCIAALHAIIAQGDLILLLHALLAVADRYDIDLDFEYRRKIAFNRTRGHRHGGKRL